jgi:hypothetical protein
LNLQYRIRWWKVLESPDVKPLFLTGKRLTGERVHQPRNAKGNSEEQREGPRGIFDSFPCRAPATIIRK